jgi:hypothetical protein
MLSWLARMVLLRFLPRRLLPVLAVADLVLLLRALRARRPVAVNEPTRSRTAPPPSNRGTAGRT